MSAALLAATAISIERDFGRSMIPQPIIIHERLGNWARQLRPRVQAWSVVVSETRSKADLVGAASRSIRPILVVDLNDQPARGLDDLALAIEAAPSSLTLVLDPRSHADVPLLAREIGATLVMSGVVVPPEVEAILARWVSFTRKRAESDGWTMPSLPRSDLEPWEQPELLLPSKPSPTDP